MAGSKTLIIWNFKLSSDSLKAVQETEVWSAVAPSPMVKQILGKDNPKHHQKARSGTEGPPSH